MADEAAVRRVLAEYCHRVDDGRLDDLVALFTEDAEFRFSRYEASGRDGLRAWFAENHPPDARGKHLTFNTNVDFDADGARAVSDFVFLGFVDGRLAPILAGRYEDELRRVDGRWLIRRRSARALRPPQ